MIQDKPLMVRVYNIDTDDESWCLIGKEFDGSNIVIAKDVDPEFVCELANRFNAMIGVEFPGEFMNEAKALLDRCNWYFEHLNHDEYQALRDDVRSFVARTKQS